MTPAHLNADDLKNPTMKTLLEMSFEEESLFFDSKYKMENHGGVIIPGGISGNCLSLQKNSYLTIEPGSLINQKAGTIIFWARPHWNYYDNVGGSLTSHTFLSFEWNDSKKSYFVISDGWWEPAGSHKTYFVLDNQQYAHTSAVHKFLKDYWVQIACSWDAHKGSIRLYIDGKLISETKNKFTSFGTQSRIFIGCDRGSKILKDRWANCDIDELQFFERSLSSDEIDRLSKKHDPDPQGRYLSYLKSLSTVKKQNGRTLHRSIRAIFDEGTGWMTHSGALQTIERIKRAGFNVYVPCVWHGRGTRYPSSVAPAENDLQFISEDPLARLIVIAHRNGIEVHPWFCVTLRQREFLKDYYGPGTPEKAFDIHRPAFRTFITGVINDVITRYEVDGINLDYIRTMGFCSCEYCQSEYYKRFDNNLMKDLHNRKQQSALKSQLQEWQDSDVKDIITRVAKEIKETRPKTIISICGNPRINVLIPNTEGRQEIDWFKLGLISNIWCMDYSNRPDFDMIQTIGQQINNQEVLIPLIANYSFSEGKESPKNAKELSIIIKFIENTLGSNVGVYLYNLLSDSQIKTIFHD